jgi:tetratricopeptide (TPR) repeat protein
VKVALTVPIFPVLFLCLLQACSSQPTQVSPPPVVDKGQQAAVPQSSDIAGRSVTSTAQPPQQTISDTSAGVNQQPAIVALLDQAELQANAGELESAAASLERAIRIDPRNAVLWYHLATVRFAQGESPQAEQLAVKSNSLASGNAAQQGRNWRLIAKARRAQNNPAGAAAADDRARELDRR